MAVSFTTLTGTTSRTGFETELAKARTWLNGGIIIGDIDATSIGRTSLYRPDTQGFPKQNSEACTQQAYDRNQAIDQTDLPHEAVSTLDPIETSPSARRGAFNVRALRGRQSIFTQYLDKDDLWHIPSMSCRFRVWDEPDHPNDSLVEFTAGFEARALSYPRSGSPDFPDTAGQFRIVYKQVGSTSAPTEVGGTKRNLNSCWVERNQTTGLPGNFTVFNMGGQATLAPGIYDAWVEYDGSSVTVDDLWDTKQVVLGPTSFVVEVQRS